jgi:hypothetical protein
MTEAVGNNENLNDVGSILIKTHFRLSPLTELTGEFDVYHIPDITYFFNVVSS